ncbi:MAG: sulfotransferase family 2 domain-containing protein [Pseudomonadota bacterium]
MTDASLSHMPGPRVDIRRRPTPLPVATAVPFSFVHINKCGGTSVEVALGLQKRHATAGAMQREMGRAAWADRFTFAIVRNPFERITSLYYYRVRSNHHGLADRHLNVNQWIRAIWQDGSEHYNDVPLLNGPCIDWLTDADGTVLVDHVARLEDIDAEWRRISQRLGIDLPLPTLNINKRPAYRDVLTPESREILEFAFAEDLSRFEYHY